ncbi:MAG: FAD-dependent oxidoreductase [Candidatus Portiera sp.]|nr:FAD-dependent oxidoreductase [Portiera sp.]
MNIKTDIAVIGGGSGGLTIAAGASQMGAKVVLVEKAKMGGDCLNYGCVPSKALLAASHQARAANPKFGVSHDQTKVDYAKVNQHVQDVIAAIAPNDSVERFTELGVKVIQGRAEFSSRNSIEVGDDTITAKYFVIATGSSPMVPPIAGLDGCPYFTNETIFDNKELPKHLLIIGGGPIGMEMAQAHRVLGAKVTVVDLGPILPRDDPSIVKIVRQQFVDDGVEFCEKVKIDKVSKSGEGIVMTITDEQGKQQQLSASHLLVAAGRIANINDLCLEKADVAFHKRGITTNQRLQTSNKKIYAIGDVASPYQFTHVAAYHAGIVIRNILFKMPAKVDYKALPWVTYTTPEIAHCGLTQQEALDKYGEKNIRRLDWSFQENDRAQAELATEGLVKALVHKNGKILGVDIVGMNAGEIVQTWALAMSNDLKIGAMAGYISPYPTLGEVSKRVAGSFYTDKLFKNPRLKAIVRLLMKF